LQQNKRKKKGWVMAKAWSSITIVGMSPSLLNLAQAWQAWWVSKLHEP
jgi:hypothetical protein